MVLIGTSREERAVLRDRIVHALSEGTAVLLQKGDELGYPRTTTAFLRVERGDYADNVVLPNIGADPAIYSDLR